MTGKWRNLRRLGLTAALMSAMVGCGLKGSLYLPRDSREPIEASDPAAATPQQPGEQKKDRAGREAGDVPHAPSAAQPDPDRPATPPRQP